MTDYDPLFTGLTRPAMKFGVPWSVYLACVTVGPLILMWSDDIVLSLGLVGSLFIVAKLLCEKDDRAIDILLINIQYLPQQPLAHKKYWTMRCYAP